MAMRTNAAAERLAAGLLMIGFDGPEPTAEAESLLRDGAFGAILFTRNYVDRAQVRGLVERLKRTGHADKRPIAVAVDHEGGRVQRFRGPGFTDTPAMRDVGAHPDGAVERAAAWGTLFAAELRPLGIDIDFAPVLDVDSNPANPVIGERSPSRDPRLVGAIGAALIAAMQAGGVAACGKHFPGHGDTDKDSHFDLPRLGHDLARLRTVELVPFRAAIAAQVATIMTSHIVFAALDAQRPATMSPAVLQGVLREELGYTGVVVSDDLEMKAVANHFPLPDAAVDAVRAGCDLLLCCHTAELQRSIQSALAKAIRDGGLDRAIVGAAHARLDALAARFVRG
jgi:beta-N-acetylhexosaminidase